MIFSKPSFLWKKGWPMSYRIRTAFPYFDNSVAVPDMLKKPYFDFDSHTPPPPPKRKIEPNPIIIRLFCFA